MKKSLKRGISLMLLLTMVIPFFMNLNIYASETTAAEAGQDGFYILDEEGNPVYVEIKQNTNGEKAITTASELSIPEDGIGIIRFSTANNPIEYDEVDTGGSGYLSAYTSADAAYIRTEDDGIVCKVGGVTLKVDQSCIENFYSYEDDLDVSYYYCSSAGYLIHVYTYNDGSDIKTSSIRVGYTPSYMKEDKNYYSYDGHYFYESFKTMIQDYRNATYENAINTNAPYYNYYQYVSFHTTSNITAEQYNEFVSSRKSESAMLDTGDDFVEVQNTYTINALLMFGVAVNESGWGTSSLAMEKNNLFGLNAVDNNAYESGETFSSIKACIDNFAYGYIHCRYMMGTHYTYRGPHIGDKNSGINVCYASDAYWGEKAASRTYYDDKEQLDYGRYTIGIATSGKIKVYQYADTDSTVIYTTDTKEGKNIYDYPVTILETVKNDAGETFYKVISDMSLQEDRSARNVEEIFDPSRDYVYVKASDIQIVFEGTGEGIDIPDQGTEEEPGTDITVDAPELLSIYSKEQSSAKATWTVVDNAEGYELWRATDMDAAESNWELIKTIKDGTTDRYTNQNLNIGTTYYYKVRAYRTDSAGEKVYSAFSEIKYMPAAVVFDKVYSNSTSRIRLLWNEINGAHGYQIWRSEDNGSTWKLIKTLGDKGNELSNNQGATTAYSNTGLEAGKTYVYKMRAFAIPENGTKVFGAYSDEYTVAVKPDTPEVSVTSPKSGRALVEWTSVSGAAGYQIWMSDSEEGTYSIVKSVTDGTASTYTKYDLTSGKTYYFKVRAYSEADGVKAFSAFSDITSVNVK